MSFKLKVPDALESVCADWMKYHQESRICDLPCIPATHNSCCSEEYTGFSIAWYWAWTQKLNILQQLNWGVRLFDVRLCDDNPRSSKITNEIFVSHTFVTKLTLKKLLEMFKTFLAENTSEVVLLWIRKDYERKLDTDTTNLANILLNSGVEFAQPGTVLFASRIKDVQGKVILLANKKMFDNVKLPPPANSVEQLPPVWSDDCLRHLCTIWKYLLNLI